MLVKFPIFLLTVFVTIVAISTIFDTSLTFLQVFWCEVCVRFTASVTATISVSLCKSNDVEWCLSLTLAQKNFAASHRRSSQEQL